MIILLAEDHVLSQALTVRLLQAEGHLVSVVGTGLQAIDSCRDQFFDVVLMDLQLPVLDGLSAIRAIREMQNKAGLSDCDRPAIWALTADSRNDVLAECLQAGADGLFIKPIQPKQLIQRIRKVDDTHSSGDHRAANHCAADHSDEQADLRHRSSVVCRDVLLDNVGQDKSLAQSLIDLFLRDYRPLFDRLVEAFHKKNFQVLMSEAHSLKSPARVFGATVLHRLCDDLERIGKTHDTDQLATIRDRFLGELKKLKSGVSEIRFE